MGDIINFAPRAKMVAVDRKYDASNLPERHAAYVDRLRSNFLHQNQNKVELPSDCEPDGAA